MSAVEFPGYLMILVIIAAVIGISALQSLIFGFASLLMRHMLHRRSRFAIDALLAALIFTAAEWVLSYGSFGFPWVITYLTQSRFLAGIQSTSLFGGHFISFLIFLFSLLLARAILSAGMAKRQIRALSAALILFLGNLSYGVAVLLSPAQEHTVKAAVYQDNHSSYEKWDSSPSDTYQAFAETFEKAFSEKTSPDMILLSETVFPIRFTAGSSETVSHAAQGIEKALCQLSRQYDTSVFCGAFYEQKDRRYNAQFLFENGKSSQQVYCKRVLVPFGEYLPYESVLTTLLPFLGQFNLSGDALTPGEGAQLFYTNNGVCGGLICYDSIFYRNARESVKEGAQILLLSTNDSWYNDSRAIDQHYAHAVFRAVENRRSIVRCAATGKSGMIDPYGRSLCQSQLFTRGILSADLPLETRMTPFSQWGYAYLPLLMALLMLLRIFLRCLLRKRGNNTVERGKQP